MSSAQIKNSLKAARESIANKDYAKALDLARKVLTSDPQNYNAHVFAGVSLLNLSQFAESEASYRDAISVNDTNPLAWQGLINLFEKQAKIDGLREASIALANLYSEANDEGKCFAVIDKYVTFVKSRGTPAQINDALDLLLPDKPYFTLIERHIPSPADTCHQIATSLEKTEREAIDREIAKRRLRLGANLDQVVRDCKREVLCRSKLEDVYQKVIDWSEDAEVRHTFESKLLRHTWETLLVCPLEEKDMRRDHVWRVAHGMVVLNLPDELAWTICMDWRNFETIEMYGLLFLQDLIRAIPQSGLAKVLSAYLKSELSRFPSETPEDERDPGDESKPKDAFEDVLDEMIEGYNSNATCITCGRILASYYLYNKEYESASEIARTTIDCLRMLQSNTGITIPAPETSLLIILATSLIHYQAPKHHPQARKLFDAILARKPDSVEALVGKGRVALDAEEFGDAVELTSKALELSPHNVTAKMEHAWALVLLDNIEEGKKELQDTLPLIDGRDPQSRDTIAEIWWRIGKCLWDESDNSRLTELTSDTETSRQDAYTAFVTCLRYNQNFAAAYASLGIFYADVMNDAARAYKCFQKAFELDAGQTEAAERLARDFADTRQWDLVEVIALRVLAASKKLLSTKRQISWPDRALGVAELNKRNYSRAIQHFQNALRHAPTDVHAWIGLGEAYANSGRHTAAIKSFGRAEVLNPGNWYAKYILGNVQKDVLEYEAACAVFKEILVDHPDEFSVSLSLAQTLLTWAYSCYRSGELSKSVEIAVEGILVSQRLVECKKELSEAWKLIGDAVFLGSLIQVDGARELLQIALDIVGIPEDAQTVVNGDYDMENGEEPMAETETKKGLLKCNVAAMEKMVNLTEGDRLAHSAAYFNLGLAKYRLLISGLEGSTPSSIRPVLECFKKAIQSEPRNFEYWNALGVVTARHFPSVSEKAFARSLQINEKNSVAWANLGLMYLLNDDDELAGQAFSRSQATDPENAVAWLGQAIFAVRNNDPLEARELFLHSFEIGESSFAEALYRFAETSFDQASTGTALHIPFPSAALFSLKTFLVQNPQDIFALHLMSLLLERDHQPEAALDTLQLVSEILEQQYEESEDPDILHRFCIVKSDIGRLALGIEDFETAIENSSTALDLSQDLEGLQKTRLSSQITLGLGRYFLGQMDDAIAAFQTVLANSNEDPDVMLLVTRALWAAGGDQEREIAIQQLKDSLAKHPQHINSLTAFGAFGVLTNNENAMRQAENNLRISKLIHKDDRDVHHLLIEIARSRGRNVDDVSRTGVMLNPSSAKEWGNLAQGGDVAAQMALKLAQRDNSIERDDLVEIYYKSGELGNIQSGILLSPWRAEGWHKLKALDIDTSM